MYIFLKIKKKCISKKPGTSFPVPRRHEEEFYHYHFVIGRLLVDTQQCWIETFTTFRIQGRALYCSTIKTAAKGTLESVSRDSLLFLTYPLIRAISPTSKPRQESKGSGGGSKGRIKTFIPLK